MTIAILTERVGDEADIQAICEKMLQTKSSVCMIISDETLAQFIPYGSSLCLSKYRGRIWALFQRRWGSGLPIVASPEEASMKVVGDVDDPEQWVETIADLIRDPERRNLLSRKGKIEAHSFEWESVAERVLDRTRPVEVNRI